MRPSDSPPLPAGRLQKSHPPPYQNMAFTEDNQLMVGFLSFFIRVKLVERKALIVDVTRGLIVIAVGHLRRAEPPLLSLRSICIPLFPDPACDKHIPSNDSILTAKVIR